jgi:threonine synthase
MMIKVSCTNCKQPYPEVTTPYNCPVCGGYYGFETLPAYDASLIDGNLPGIWRYRHTFNLPDVAPVVYLGEGDTPLILTEAFGRQIAFKLEYLNPTGSFKDRGTALLISFLKSRGIESAVEDSSGNAGASFAAYASRAGVRAKVFIPGYASGPKRAQIEAYGAQVELVPGPRSNASDAVRRAAENGDFYASHVYLPFGLSGFATIAYEIVEQIGESPGSIVLPVGQGSQLLGLGIGFLALQEAGIVSQLPQLVGVQALACAPLWAVFKYGAAGMGFVSEGETLAEGVRIKHPLRGDLILKIVEDSDGLFVAVDESKILEGVEQLAKMGFFVEPTSAIIWDGLSQVKDQIREPIVAILTGTGLKAIK